MYDKKNKKKPLNERYIYILLKHPLIIAIVTLVITAIFTNFIGKVIETQIANHNNYIKQKDILLDSFIENYCKYEYLTYNMLNAIVKDGYTYERFTDPANNDKYESLFYIEYKKIIENFEFNIISMDIKSKYFKVHNQSMFLELKRKVDGIIDLLLNEQRHLRSSNLWINKYNDCINYLEKIKANIVNTYNQINSIK